MGTAPGGPIRGWGKVDSHGLRDAVFEVVGATAGGAVGGGGSPCEAMMLKVNVAECGLEELKIAECSWKQEILVTAEELRLRVAGGSNKEEWRVRVERSNAESNVGTISRGPQHATRRR